jgi:glutathione S-transferase
MKLYSTALSPYARKVAIVAHEHRIFERIELVPTKLTPPNAELMQHNPLNKVPTLVLDDGTALYDSIVICEYLDSVGPGPKLFPANGAARWDALRRHALGNGFADLLIAWRTEMTSPQEQQSQERLDKYAFKTARTLAALEAAATSQRTFDIGDISIGCALAYQRFRFPQLAPAAGSALDRWYAAFDARPSVAATRIEGA